MEQSKNKFLIDVLNILPEEVECFIQAPSLDNNIVNDMLKNSDYDYYKLLRLDKVSKDKFIRQELETSFSIYIQSIEIKKNGILLFEGFDGVEFGMISQKVLLPGWFKKHTFQILV
jgi:hypothetical protein